MAKPETIQAVKNELIKQDPDWGMGANWFNISSQVAIALDAGITGPEIVGVTAGNVMAGSLYLRNLISERAKASKASDKAVADYNKNQAGSVDAGFTVAPNEQKTNTAPVPTSVTGGTGLAAELAKRANAAGIPMSEDDAMAIVAASNAGNTNAQNTLQAYGLIPPDSKGSGGDKGFAPPSPLDIARAGQINELTIPGGGALIHMPGLGNGNMYRINGTDTLVDSSDKTKYTPLIIDGKPTGYTVNSEGKTINLATNAQEDAKLGEIIRHNKEVSGETARSNRVSEGLAAGTLAETVRRNQVNEQQIREQQAQTEANTIASMQADPGKFVQREYTLAGALRPSGIVESGTYSPPVIQQPVMSVAQQGAMARALEMSAAINNGTAPSPQTVMPNSPLDRFIRSGGTEGTPQLAHGGMTTAPQMITGDPQAGQVTGNPELINNPTGAPISVQPMSDAQQQQQGIPPDGAISGAMSAQDKPAAAPKEENPAADMVGTVSKIMGLISKMIKPGEDDEVAYEIGKILLTKLGNGSDVEGTSMMAGNKGAMSSAVDASEGMPPKFAYGTADYTSKALREKYGFSPTPSEDIAGLPSLGYLSGTNESFNRGPLSRTTEGAFGTQLPEGNAINYGRYLDIRSDPTTYGLLSSLYRSGSRNLDSEAARAKRLAPGQGTLARTVRT